MGAIEISRDHGLPVNSVSPNAVPSRGVPSNGRPRPLWALPRRARPFVLAVNALYLGSLAVGVATTRPKMSDVLTFAVLAACAVLSIEGSLRLVWRGPKPGRTTNDMLAVWTIPVPSSAVT